MATLPQALDNLIGTEFSRMTSRNCREALKEITKAPNEQVINKEVQRLDVTQQDTLMKVVYVGLSTDPAASSVLLKWHAALFETAGPGAIVRTLTDKHKEEESESASAAAKA